MTDDVFDAAHDRPVVRIVDDQASVRDAIGDLLASVGIATVAYPSAQAFLDEDSHEHPGCLVLDVRMPGLGGMDLQTELNRRAIPLPIIFVTGHGDIPMSVRAMKAGAVDFLTKPFDDQALIDAVNAACQRDATERQTRLREADAKARFDALNRGERDVVALTAEGLKIREIAERLGVSEITVKVRRARAMEKLDVSSLPELIRYVVESS
jgi:FixJ family two-component response regulator